MLTADDIKILPIFKSLPDTVAAIGRVRYDLYPDMYGGDEVDACRRALARYSDGSCSDRPMLFGAYHNGDIVGFASVGNLQNAPAEPMYLKELYVRRKYQHIVRQKQGMTVKLYVGSRLLASAERTMGLYGSAVQLESLVGGIPLYEKRGYEIHNKWSYAGNSYKKVLATPDDGVHPLFYLNNRMFADMAAVFRDSYPSCNDDVIRGQILNIRDAIDEYKWPTWGYFIGGRMVGFLQANKIFNAQEMRLNKLYVLQKYQRKSGVGSELLNQFINYADTIGMNRTWGSLLQDPSDESYALGLIRFYEKFGFRPFDDGEAVERIAPNAHSR